MSSMLEIDTKYPPGGFFCRTFFLLPQHMSGLCGLSTRELTALAEAASSPLSIAVRKRLCDGSKQPGRRRTCDGQRQRRLGRQYTLQVRLDLERQEARIKSRIEQRAAGDP